MERRQPGWLDRLAGGAADARGTHVGYRVEGTGKAGREAEGGAGVGLCAWGSGGVVLALGFEDGEVGLGSTAKYK